MAVKIATCLHIWKICLSIVLRNKKKQETWISIKCLFLCWSAKHIREFRRSEGYVKAKKKRELDFLELSVFFAIDGIRLSSKKQHIFESGRKHLLSRLFKENNNNKQLSWLNEYVCILFLTLTCHWHFYRIFVFNLILMKIISDLLLNAQI